MKKLILSIFVAGALAFGLQSCGSDEPCDGACSETQTCVDDVCVDNVVACDECGTYNGTVSSAPGDTLMVQGIIDSVLVDFPATATVAETATANTLSLTIDLTINGVQVNPTVNGTLAGSTLTVTDEIYNYLGIVDILVNGTMNFDGSGGTTGDLTLGNGPATPVPAVAGNLVFTGSK